MTTALRNIWLSAFEYRPNPARPLEGRIPLGLIRLMGQGPSRSGRWYVRGLSQEELERMDGIARELLVHPGEYLRQELSAVYEELKARDEMGSAQDLLKQPYATLTVLAERNEWAIYVSPPVPFPVRVKTLEDKKGAIERATKEALVTYLQGGDPFTSPSWTPSRPVPGAEAMIPPAFQIATSDWNPHGGGGGSFSRRTLRL